MLDCKTPKVLFYTSVPKISISSEIGNFRSFFAPSPFIPIIIQKIKILKKWKKLLEISSFYTYVPKITITWCTIPETRSETDRIRNTWD